MSQKNKMLVLYSVVRNYLDTIQEKKFSNLKSFGLLVCTVSRNFRNIRKVSCLCRYVENFEYLSEKHIAYVVQQCKK